MRVPTLLVAAGLALVSLTLAPSASADFPPCGPVPMFQYEQEHPAGTFRMTSNYLYCQQDVYVNDKECANGDDDWNTVPLWLFHVYYVHVNLCGDPDQGVLNDPLFLVPGEPPELRPFDACPGGLDAPDATAPHVGPECNPDPHLTHSVNLCWYHPRYDNYRTVSYQNVHVSYNECLHSLPGVSNPFYGFPSDECGPVPENGVATLSDDCRHIYQEHGCPDGADKTVYFPSSTYNGRIHHCGPV